MSVPRLESKASDNPKSQKNSDSYTPSKTENMTHAIGKEMLANRAFSSQSISENSKLSPKQQKSVHAKDRSPSLDSIEVSKKSKEKAIERKKYASSKADKDGNTELHSAIVSNIVYDDKHLQQTYSAIKKLLKRRIFSHGIDPNIQNKEGNTALHKVGELKFWNWFNEAVINLLVEYEADVNLANGRGETPLHKIIKARGSSSSIENLLKAGANANLQDNEGNTPLHLLAQHSSGSSDPFKKEVAELLVKHGANVDIPNKKGNTPLHDAIDAKRDDDDIRFFLEKGAKPNTPNNEGDTPLHRLASLNDHDMYSHGKVVKLLIDKGADIKMKNNKGELPIHKAYRRGESQITCLLIGDGMDFMAQDSEGMTLLHLAATDSKKGDEFKKILEKSKDVTTQDKKGNTALHVAASSGFFAAVKDLIEKAADIEAHNLEEQTPLQRAVARLLSDFYEEISTPTKLEEMNEIISVLQGKREFKVESAFADLRGNVLRSIINLLLKKGAKTEVTLKFCESWKTKHSHKFKRKSSQRLLLP